MMVNKILAAIIGSLIVLFILAWTIFYFVQQEANREVFNRWYENEYKEQHYFGTVRTVNSYNTNNCLLSISISDQNSQWISYSYNCACEVEGFMDFVQEGDSIMKKKNETRLIFVKPDGRRKSFEPPFCELR